MREPPTARWTVEASAPIRCDLTGAYTDCPPSVDQRTSLIVNLALNHRAEAGIRAGSEPGVYVTTGGGRQLAPQGLCAVVASTADQTGVRDVVIDVTLPVPPGTGLGTSAAQGVAVAAACARYAGQKLSLDELAELAAAAERRAGIAGGRQDQYAAAHGGAHLWRIGPGNAAVAGTTLTIATAIASGSLLLAHPGGTRDSGSLVDAIAERQRHHRPTLAALKQLNGLAQPIAGALASGDLPSLAEILHAVRAAQHALHPDVVDQSVEQRIHALPEVLAAKPCGGGGPGSAWLVLCKPGASASVAVMLPAAGLRPIPVQLDPAGVAVTVHGEIQIGGTR